MKSFKLVYASLVLVAGLMWPRCGFAFTVASGGTVLITAGQDATRPGPTGCPGFSGGTAGTFVITVSPPYTNAMSISVARGGTALGLENSPQDGAPCYVSDADYAVDYQIPYPCPSNFSSEQILIPANSPGVTVTVSPFFDYECKSNQTVTMNLNSVSAPRYVIDPNNAVATIQLFDTDTIGSTLTASNTTVMEGETMPLICARFCGCDYPKPLFNTPVYNQFHLLGNARYGIDYLINPTDGVYEIATNSESPELLITLGTSNSFLFFSVTTFSNCDFGDRTLVFVPQCNFELYCYYGPPLLTNNAEGCPYYLGLGESILTIQHPTNQPTLDSAMYSSSNSVFQFNINGQNGATYSILTSTDLVNWSSVTAFNMTYCTMQASDKLADDFPQHFYRIMVGGNLPADDKEFTFQEATPSPQMSQAYQAGNLMQSGVTRANAAAAATEMSSEDDPLTSEEQYLLIEAQRLQWEGVGNPATAILPPTPLTPAVLPSKANQIKR